MRMSLERLSLFSIVAAEFLGIFALFLTSELSEPVFAGILLTGLFLFLAKVRLSDRWLLIFTVGVLLFTAISIIQSTVLVAAGISRGILLMHTLIWISASGRKFRYWRLGIAFLEILLASVLAPETYMFILIFIFVMIASLSLSLGFLEKEFRTRDPDSLNKPIKAAFVFSVLGLSFLAFLSSLLIFPLLPRSNYSGLGQSWVEPGYSEIVNFGEDGLIWSKGSSRPMVWVFLPEGQNWQSIAPFGLLRGKVLETFNEAGWSPASKQLGVDAGVGSGVRFEIFREALNSDVLIVPYGTSIVRVDGKERQSHLSGEYPALSHRNRRVQYEVELGSGETQRNEPVKKVHLARPDPAAFAGLIALADRLKKGTRSDQERIRNVVRHLDNYKASYAPTFPFTGGGRHPVEHFLFESKEGHCELFATAAALLFRSMGIPSRLVAGFRGRLPSGSVFMLRNTDAHAWVEVWTPSTGWTPIDPTPFIEAKISWMDPVHDFYEHFNVYWHQYILGYEFDWRKIRAWWKSGQLPQTVVGLAGFLVLAALIGVLSQKKFTRKPRAPRYQVTNTWRKLEKQLENIRPGDRAFLLKDPAWNRIEGRYLELRFGKKLPAQAELVEFKIEAHKVIRSFRASVLAKEIGR